MSKISTHKDKDKIEILIIQSKFKGLGSAEIQKALLNKLAFKVSRPTIDEYYNKHLHGNILTEEIEKAVKNAILSVSNNETIDNEKPAYKADVAESIYTFVGEYDSTEWADRPEVNATFQVMRDAYSQAIGLLMGNINAHREGKERLKPEYVKYVNEIRCLMRLKY